MIIVSDVDNNFIRLSCALLLDILEKYLTMLLCMIHSTDFCKCDIEQVAETMLFCFPRCIEEPEKFSKKSFSY